MGRTIADELRAEGLKEGEIRGRRQILLSLLQHRFGEVPPEIRDRIASTEDIKQLDGWLRRFVTATTLKEMEIGPRKRLR
jgi:hypothetical protein